MTAGQPMDPPTSDEAIAAMRAIMERPTKTMIALDFDGTLAPIVDDPEQAVVHPAAVDALARLGPQVGVIAVITGRPVRTAVRLGGFDDRSGLESMIILGQYGVERWNAADDSYRVPPEPDEIAAIGRELDEVLERLAIPGVRVEHKGRAIGVHTREARGGGTDAFDRLKGPVSEVAERHGLHLEPGKMVLEIRMPGMDKGVALAELIEETGMEQVIFAGDDLGDLPAFEKIIELRGQGLPGLLVCSASEEEKTLSDLADLIVEGPQGVAEWLDDLASSLDRAH